MSKVEIKVQAKTSQLHSTDPASVVIMAIILAALAFFFLDALWAYGGYPV